MKLTFQVLDTQEIWLPEYELIMHMRDSFGQPTGRTKSIKSGDPNKLDEFWNRYQGKPKRKKKRKQAKKGDYIPTSKETQQIVQEVNKYAETVSKNRMNKLGENTLGENE